MMRPVWWSQVWWNRLWVFFKSTKNERKFLIHSPALAAVARANVSIKYYMTWVHDVKCFYRCLKAWKIYWLIMVKWISYKFYYFPFNSTKQQRIEAQNEPTKNRNQRNEGDNNIEQMRPTYHETNSTKIELKKKMIWNCYYYVVMYRYLNSDNSLFVRWKPYEWRAGLLTQPSIHPSIRPSIHSSYHWRFLCAATESTSQPYATVSVCVCLPREVCSLALTLAMPYKRHNKFHLMIVFTFYHSINAKDDNLLWHFVLMPSE